MDRNRLDTSDRTAHDWYRFVLSFPPDLVRDYVTCFGSLTITLDSMLRLHPQAGAYATQLKTPSNAARSGRWRAVWLAGQRYR